ncbi:cell division ATP-binding protein FtsE [Candidatus Microgenomates bacterium]|nr:cell division ATP-binding protein FtsE [Candidatus Microgenomates bacterium]
MSALILFNKVSKSFGSIKALDNVSFEIDKGDFIFIIGPSGAGKTTILKLLTAEFKPSSGDISVDNHRISDLTKKDIPYYRQKIGIVFQDFKLLSERTVRENIEVPLAVKGIDESEWESRANQVLKLVGLADRSELFPSQLSGGEVQRVAIARALVTNPTFIFADEPTGNLDWETAESIMDLLLRINNEGKTVIVTSHHKTLVHKLKKRVIEMSNGKIVSDSKSIKEKKEK